MKTNRLFCVSFSSLSTLALICVGQGETNAFNKTEILQYLSENSVVKSDLLNKVLIVGRYIAIDNVCAWPNLTMLKDGTVIATIFNKPSHGLTEGDVECWASKDGKLWERRGTPALHDSTMTNQTNVAAGLAGNGDLVILSSGWLLQPANAPNPPRGSIIHTWICRSADDGKNWVIDKISFPLPESDHLATGIKEKIGSGSYSNIACINPDAARKWYDIILFDVEKGTLIENMVRKFFDEEIIPLASRGYSDPALDKLLAAVGGKMPVNTRLRWPYKSVDDKQVIVVRAAARKILPDFFDIQ